MRNLGFTDGAEDEEKPEKVVIDFEVGDSVVVTKGVWKDTVGVITAINEHKKVVSMNVDMFGRATKIDIEFGELKKL